MRSEPFSTEQLADYQREGFLLATGLFTTDEIDLLRRSAKEDRALDQNSFGKADGEGGRIRLSLWNHPGEGIYGMFARCGRIVDRCEQLLDDEVYHYHSKMIMKDALIGGAWTWHQDYGYWYQNGVLFPELVSVFIAVDPCTIQNGCLQVIPGSQRMGRIEHVLSGEQAGADMERVTAVLQRLPLLHMEMQPGDALFFHPNLLHRSDRNHSPDPRWSMICCYNARKNDPYKTAHHPNYTPLEKVGDEMILQVGIRRFDADNTDVAWLNPERDASAKSLVKE